jgi:hypothetical protein
VIGADGTVEEGRREMEDEIVDGVEKKRREK